MKIAGLTLLRWVAAADTILTGMRLRRVLQLPEIDAYALHLTGRCDRFLLLPGKSIAAPCYFEDKKQLQETLPEYQPTEKFNRLRGRRLLGTQSFPGDRRLGLHFGPRPDKEGDTPVSLVLHLMGAAPLCLLVDADGKVVEADRRSTKYPSSQEYTPPPPPELAEPLGLTFPEYLRLRRKNESMSLADCLREKLWGLDEELAQLFVGLTANPKQPSDAPDIDLWPDFHLLKRSLREFVDPTTSLFLDAETGTISGWSRDDSRRGGLTINDILRERMVTALAEDDRESILSLWKKFVSFQTKKIGKAEGSLAKRRDEVDHAELYKQFGDILNIYRNRLTKGLEKIELPNVYDDNRPVTIMLDQQKNVQENIERYYKKHRKGLSGKAAIAAETERLARARELLAMMAATLEKIADDNAVPVYEWSAALRRIEIEPPQPPAPKKKFEQKRRLPYHEFTLAGGEVIWVGRSSRENDVLSARLATKTDYFLHARQSTGAHVILKHDDPKNPPAESSLHRAAVVAAFFSEAKHSSAVAVAYTPVKYVRKPRKAPPGLVTLMREEVIVVEPSPPPGYHK